MEKLLDEIESYWNTRTEGYSEVNHKELAGTQKNAWLKVLTSQFPDKPKEEIRILDIGTGPGFFPVILAEAGYHVDAVDYTEGMLEKAKENAGDLCRNIRFLRMDAQKLDFEDNTFDSNLDSLNEGIILKSLKEDKANRTVVLVSHRTSTMKVADVVYEMENGRLS